MARRTTQSNHRYELVMEELMERAAQLFALQGVGGTSMQELADAVGISRTSLYHYIGGKEEMLTALVQGFSRPAADELERLAADSERPAVTRLGQGVYDQAFRVASDPVRFRLLLTSEGALPDPVAAEHRAARRRTLSALTRLVGDAIAEGSLRPVDVELAAFSIFGMCNWIAFWYQPGREGAMTPEAVADHMATVALHGMLIDEDRAASGENSVGQVIDLLREDLTRLERMLENG